MSDQDGRRPCPYCKGREIENHCEECDGTGEAARHILIDIGNGSTATFSVRGDVDEESMEAFRNLAQAAWDRLGEADRG